jgi:hypothetical protein
LYRVKKRGQARVDTAVSALMRYILAPSSLAGRGLGVGFLYLITSGSAVDKNEREKSIKFHYLSFSDLIKFNFILLFLANQYFYLNKFS